MTITTNMQVSDDTADLIIIMGNDNPGQSEFQEYFKKAIRDCQSKNLKYIILGDGKAGVNLDDIKNLPKAKHVAIFGHGSIEHDKHFISLTNGNSICSLDVVSQIQKHTEAKNIVAGICYGGKIVEDLKGNKERILLQGTNLFVASPPDETSFIRDNIAIFTMFISKIIPNQEASMIELVRDTITTIPQSMVFAHQPEDDNEKYIPIQSHSIRRTDRADQEVYFEVRKYWQYLLDGFNEYIEKLINENQAKSFITFIEKTYPQFKMKYLAEKPGKGFHQNLKFNLLKIDMKSDQVMSYQATSLLNHALHNDTTVMDALLSKTPFDSQLLYTIIETKYYHHLENMVNILLKHSNTAMNGQNVNSFRHQSYLMGWHENELDHTPLTLALENGKIEIVKVLLMHGANIYLADKMGRIPNDEISTNIKYASIYKEMLKEAKDISHFAYTFYHDSFINSHQPGHSLENLRKMVEGRFKFEVICNAEGDRDFFEGKSALPKNKTVWNALQDFIQATSLVMLTLDIRNKNTDPALVCIHDSLPIFHAAKNGHSQLINKILQKGGNIHLKDEDSNSLLHIAVENKHLNLVRYLLENGLDANAVNNVSLTPLHLAAKSGNLPILKELLSYGAKMEMRDTNGKTALHFAAQNRSQTIAIELINRNADIRATDNEGRTPLHVAVSYGRIEVIQELLNADANIHMPDKKNVSPVQLAINQNRQDIVAIFKSFENEKSSSASHISIYSHISVADKYTPSSQPTPPSLPRRRRG